MSNIDLKKVKYIHSQKHRLSVGWVPDDENKIVLFAFAFMNDKDQFEKKVARNIINARLISSRDHSFYTYPEYSNKSDALKVSSLIKALNERLKTNGHLKDGAKPPRLKNFIEEMSDRYFESGLTKTFYDPMLGIFTVKWEFDDHVTNKDPIPKPLPHHLNYPYTVDGNKVFFVHNAKLGVSLGYVGIKYSEGEPTVRWVYAFTHPKDQFTKSKAREVLMFKLKHEDYGDFYESYSYSDDPFSESIIDDVTRAGGESSTLLNEKIDAFWNQYNNANA